MSPLAPGSMPSSTETPKVLYASSVMLASLSLPFTHHRSALMPFDRRRSGPCRYCCVIDVCSQLMTRTVFDIAPDRLSYIQRVPGDPAWCAAVDTNLMVRLRCA